MSSLYNDEYQSKALLLFLYVRTLLLHSQVGYNYSPKSIIIIIAQLMFVLPMKFLFYESSICSFIVNFNMT